MKDPFGLEPADGDYVAYIEKLQAGKIRNLDPLKTAASSPAATNPVPPGVDSRGGRRAGTVRDGGTRENRHSGSFTDP